MQSIKNIKLSGSLLIIIAATLWALDGVVRRNLYTLPPITIIFFEHLIGFLLLLPFVWKQLLVEKLGTREFLLILFVSFLSGLLGTLWFTTALLQVHFISFSVVFLLQKLQPLFAISSASIFLKEKLDTRYLKWALFALIGAYFVTFKNGTINLATDGNNIVAALYALGAAAAWGTSTTFSKMLLNKVSFKVTTLYRFAFTMLFALGAIFIFHVGSLVMPSVPELGLFAIIALSTGMVALLIYYRGLQTTPVHISTILELCFPFIAVFIDKVIYHQVLSSSQIIGACVLVFSIYQIAQINNQHGISVKTN